MSDPGQRHYHFLAGPTLVAAELNVGADLMLVVLPNATITAAAFYTAIALNPPTTSSLTLGSDQLTLGLNHLVLGN